MPINVTAFYDVVLQGRYRNQNIFNVLHYRLGEDPIPGAWNLAGAEELAEAVHVHVWTNGLQARMSEQYLLDKIVVTPRNPDFATIYSLPFTREVGEYGVKVGALTGPATCIIANFVLEPTSVLNDFHPPKRGYVALGPIEEAAIDDDGNLEGADFAAWDTSVQCLADNLPIGVIPIATFYPIRVSTVKVLGVITLRGWADVSAVTVNHKTSFRRSRLGEA